MKITSYILRNFIYLLLIFTLIYLFIFVSNLKCNTSESRVIKTTIKKHISRKNLIPSDTIYPPPEIIKQTECLTDTIFFFDTIYIIKNVVNDYFTKYNIKDTIKLDTVGMVFLNDSITQNCLFYRGIDYSINSYTKIQPQKYLFRGSYGGFYMNYDTINVAGINIAARVKKVTIGIGYGKDLNRLFDKNNNVIMFSLQKNFEIKRKRLSLYQN